MAANDTSDSSAEKQSVMDILNQSVLKDRLVPPSRQRPSPDVKWDKYVPYVRPDFLEPRPFDMKEARVRQKEFLAMKDHRLSCLEEFLLDNGIPLDRTDAGLQRINIFLCDNIHANEELSDIHLDWLPFVWDCGLLLGEEAIHRAKSLKKLKWGLRNISFVKSGPGFNARHQITGYGSVACEWKPDVKVLQAARGAVTRDRGSKASDKDPELCEDFEIFVAALAGSFRKANFKN